MIMDYNIPMWDVGSRHRSAVMVESVAYVILLLMLFIDAAFLRAILVDVLQLPMK